MVGAANAARPIGQPRRRDNTFDFLRWCAATLVVLGHSPVLVGREHILVWGMPISTFGVLIFFSISGYLVTDSWIRGAEVGPFFRKRALRIFPALVACVTLSVVLLGPALTTLDPSAYWLNAHTWSYFANCVLKMQYALPGVFASNPVPGLVNGSLWTLPVEFFCYVAVCAIGYADKKWQSAALLMTSVIAVSLAVAAFHFTFDHSGRVVGVYGIDVGAASKVMPYFFVGSALRWRGDRVVFRLDVALLLIGVLTASSILAWWRVTAAVAIVSIPYAVIAVGLQRTPILARWGRRGDFSYGLYLYAFPVQQTMIGLLGPRISTFALFLLSEGVAMILAVASWHLVEKTALALKPAKPQTTPSDAFAETDGRGTPSAGRR